LPDSGGSAIAGHREWRVAYCRKHTAAIEETRAAFMVSKAA